jgi:hypothetical protein
VQKCVTDRRQHPNLTYVAETVVDLLQSTVPGAQNDRNVAFLAEHFQKALNQNTFLCVSSLYGRTHEAGRVAPMSKAEQRMGAKLHCLYGLPIHLPFNDIEQATRKPIYPYAMSRVYDLRSYTRQTFWGPFLDDGSQNVDWEKVEAIMVVIDHKLQLITENDSGCLPGIWTNPFAGATPNSCSLVTPTASDEPPSYGDFQDPYNISGTWIRVRWPRLALSPLFSLLFPAVLTD